MLWVTYVGLDSVGYVCERFAGGGGGLLACLGSVDDKLVVGLCFVWISVWVDLTLGTNCGQEVILVALSGIIV